MVVCSSSPPNAIGERLVSIRMTIIVRGVRLRMDNKAMRYQFGYEGSVTACAALWAALEWNLANLSGD